MKDPLDISHKISSALNRSEAVVALESSVIAQGLPSPVNVETALAMEQIVCEAGAAPATIGVIGGKVRVGLGREEIEKLGQGDAAKLAVRDIPNAVVAELDGGTTVSATARIASAVGIGVMATGGIGGVHRGSESTHDVSADLWEMARTPMVIVSSGPKAVLDVAATAEWLESYSVPVYGYETDELPGFYSRSSGIRIPKYDSVCALADVIRLGFGAMGMRSAVLVAVPVPESDEIDLSGEIDQAAKEAAESGIAGKELTPWLLKRVGELTGGKSLAANVALLKNNARVAAELACALLDDARRRMGFMV
jgi:pseudouridine-5'-phosphate glycosidase